MEAEKIIKILNKEFSLTFIEFHNNETSKELISIRIKLKKNECVNEDCLSYQLKDTVFSKIESILNKLGFNKITYNNTRSIFWFYK